MKKSASFFFPGLEGWVLDSTSLFWVGATARGRGRGRGLGGIEAIGKLDALMWFMVSRGRDFQIVLTLRLFHTFQPKSPYIANCTSLKLMPHYFILREM